MHKSKFQKIRMMRPCVVIIQQNTVIEETLEQFQKRVQDFMDDRREAGEAENMQITWLGNTQVGITACVTYLELDRILTVNPRTGEEISSESPSGLLTPSQKKIVPVT